jgi:hypothetical protein
MFFSVYNIAETLSHDIYIERMTSSGYSILAIIGKSAVMMDLEMG